MNVRRKAFFAAAGFNLFVLVVLTATAGLQVALLTVTGLGVLWAILGTLMFLMDQAAQMMGGEGA